MPQITTIRVVRKRSYQPEQFGQAGAEVELVGNLLEGEDHMTVARKMLADSRALVYENLSLKLPASAVKAAKEVDTPEETATVETSEEEPAKESAKEPAKKRGPGRPRGSKNTAPKKNTAAAKAKEKAAKEAASDDDIPGDEEPNIRSNPEDRKNPDDDVPGDDIDIDAGEAESDFTAEDLHNHIISAIKADKLTTMQAKQMQREMGVVRVRDLDTPEKLAKAKTMIDSFIKANEAK